MDFQALQRQASIKMEEVGTSYHNNSSHTNKNLPLNKKPPKYNGLGLGLGLGLIPNPNPNPNPLFGAEIKPLSWSPLPFTVHLNNEPPHI